MRYQLVSIAALLVACGGAEKEKVSGLPDMAAVSEPAVDSGPIQYGADRGLDAELEADLARFFREPLLITRPMPADALKVVLQRELGRYRALNSPLAAAAEDPELRPIAAFRRAQLFARMGCSIAQAPPPNRLAEEQGDVYRQLLREQAFAVFQQAATTLELVPDDDPLSEFAVELAAIPEGPKMAQQFDTYCSTTSGYWADTDNMLTVDETERPRCEERDAIACYVWAELGSGGDEAMAKACTLGAMVACPPEPEGQENERSDGGKSGVYGTKEMPR